MARLGATPCRGEDPRPARQVARPCHSTERRQAAPSAAMPGPEGRRPRAAERRSAEVPVGRGSAAMATARWAPSTRASRVGPRRRRAAGRPDPGPRSTRPALARSPARRAAAELLVPGVPREARVGRWRRGNGRRRPPGSGSGTGAAVASASNAASGGGFGDDFGFGFQLALRRGRHGEIWAAATGDSGSRTRLGRDESRRKEFRLGLDRDERARRPAPLELARTPVRARQRHGSNGSAPARRRPQVPWLPRTPARSPAPRRRPQEPQPQAPARSMSPPGQQAARRGRASLREPRARPRNPNLGSAASRRRVHRAAPPESARRSSSGGSEGRFGSSGGRRSSSRARSSASSIVSSTDGRSPAEVGWAVATGRAVAGIGDRSRGWRREDGGRQDRLNGERRRLHQFVVVGGLQHPALAASSGRVRQRRGRGGPGLRAGARTRGSGRPRCSSSSRRCTGGSSCRN